MAVVPSGFGTICAGEGMRDGWVLSLTTDKPAGSSILKFTSCATPLLCTLTVILALSLPAKIPRFAVGNALAPRVLGCGGRGPGQQAGEGRGAGAWLTGWLGSMSLGLCVAWWRLVCVWLYGEVGCGGLLRSGAIGREILGYTPTRKRRSSSSRAGKVLNPETGIYVLRTGKIGKQVLADRRRR